MNSGYTLKQEQERPVRRTLCGVLRRDTNWKCLILTFLIQGCLVAIGWCRNTQVTKIILNFDAFPITSSKQVSPCDEGYVYIPTAFVIMLYLLYLVECWHSKARIQLSLKKTDVNSVYQKIHEMREAQPIVWWKAICYHYVRRQRQITRYRNGGAYTSSQVFYERVNSNAVASYFYHTVCGMKDISKNVQDLETHLATRIKFSKGFIFANVATASEFEEQRSAFFQEQERVDDYMEMRECLELSNINFQESLVAWNRPESLPWFARNKVFWISSFLLLSWPIRILLELNTAHLHYKITKLFGGNYPSNPNLHEIQRPLLYSDYLTHMQAGRRRGFYNRAPVAVSNRLSPAPRRNYSYSSAQVTPSALTPSASPPSSPTPTDHSSLFHKKNLAAHIHPCWSPSLPRSVTLMLGPNRFYDYLDQAHLTKRSQFLSNASLLDTSSSLIPSYSQALLLLDGPKGDSPEPSPNHHITSSLSSSHQGLALTTSASHPTTLHQPNLPNEHLQRSELTSDSASPASYSEQNGEDGNELHNLFAGVEIDLTEPVVSSLADYSTCPPTYLEALQTSRPVFLPAFTRLRRCLTERDISGTSRSWDRDRERLQSWLNYVSPSFLQRFRLPFSITNSTRNSSTNILSSRNLRDSATMHDKDSGESNL